MSPLLNLALLAVSAAISVAGDFWFKRFAGDGGMPALAGGLGLYLFSLTAFALSLRTGPLLTNGAVFVILNGIGVFLLSRFVFHEALATRQWLGLALGIAAVALMEL